MISKKVEKMIDEIHLLLKEKAKRKFEENKKTAGMIYSVVENDDKVTCQCFSCGKKSVININEVSSILYCPNCKNTNVQPLDARYYNSYQKMIAIRGVCEIDNNIILAMFNGYYSINEGEIVFEEPQLKNFFCYEKDTRKLAHYDNDDFSWAKKKPKYYYNYNMHYGSGKTIYAPIGEKESLFAELPFMKGERLSLEHQFIDIQRAYDRYIRKNPIEKKGTENVNLPKEVRRISQNDFLPIIPLLKSFKIVKNGQVTTCTCKHCGKVQKLMQTYFIPETCECSPDAKDSLEILAVDSMLFEDKSIVLTFATCIARNETNSEEYQVDTKYFSIQAYIYAKDNNIYFFNSKGINCKLSDINSVILQFYNRSNHYWTNIDFKSFKDIDELKSDIKNSVLGNIGWTNLIENNDEGFVKSMVKYINYLELYSKAKCMEQIAKLNMKNLIDDLCKKTSIPKIIKKKETEAAKILGLTSFQLKQLRQAHAGFNELERFLKILSNDSNALYEDCKVIVESDEIFSKYEEIISLEIPNLNSNIKKLTSYLQSLDDYQCIGIDEGMRIWIDYIRMCKELKCDLKDKSLVYTNSLKLSHDRMVKKYNNLKNKEIIKSFDDAIKRYEHLSYETDDFLIRPPVSQEELYEEGRKLNHCVGSYAKSVAEGRTIILFLRNKINPDVPYVTIQISKTSIVQAKGKYNVPANRFNGVKSFMDEWIKEKGLTFKHY